MISALTIWATVIAPSLASILITIAYLPQVITLYKTKSAKNISLGFWILITAFLVCMLSNATFLLITAGSVGYFVTELVNFVLAAVVLIQVIYYGRKDKKAGK